MEIQNPVLPGFYPDPSVCRGHDGYYLVTSSFEYFPGVPVFRSTDLRAWSQVGHCLTRPSQLDLEQARSSAGIWAPTIRYHNGLYYMTTTNTSGEGNMILTSADPAAEWSDPVYVDQPGVDPSLSFLDDGSVLLSTSGSQGIRQSVIDPMTGEIEDGPRVVWSGSGGSYPEAPHLYRIQGVYYLFIAEGGTEYGHMITVARSADPWGPYEPCPRNPILSHRYRGESAVQGTGHGDLIQDESGEWLLFFLAFRPATSRAHHLGRETFVAGVRWDDDGWPVVNEGEPISADDGDLRDVGPGSAFVDEFTEPEFHHRWNYLRNPAPDASAASDGARLVARPRTLDSGENPTWVGVRQSAFYLRVRCTMQFEPLDDAECAGVVCYANERHYYSLEATRAANRLIVRTRIRLGSLESVLAKGVVAPGPVVLQIEATRERYRFAVLSDGSRTTIGEADTRFLSSEVAGGFTGVYIAMFAQDTLDRGHVARFARFSLERPQ